MRICITNISKLLQVFEEGQNINRILGLAMNELPCLLNAYIIIENKIISEYGAMQDWDSLQYFDEIIDAKQGIVMPAFIDSHTHLVFAATRESEFVDRINGLSYAAIAERGGGILNSAAKLQTISQEALLDISIQRLENAVSLGTGVIEIKSGYGLTVEAEIKMLRVIQQLKALNIIPIKASFLGAHAFPMEYKTNHSGYIDLIVQKMLPQIASEGLADYIDVFCEHGFFSEQETARILEAGAKYGLKPKIHANQLQVSGGVQVGVAHQAISVDHLESMGEAEISCLQNSDTIPVLLPGAAFFLGMHYQPARALIDANLPVALASDYNPGSCPSANMQFITSLACTQMRMTPAEAINACTINAAAALEWSNTYGVIQIGKPANLIITKPMQSEALLPYSFGENMVARTII